MLAVRGDQEEEAVVPQVVDAGRPGQTAAGSGPAGLGHCVQCEQLAIHGRYVLAVGDAAGDVEVVPAGYVADELGEEAVDALGFPAVVRLRHTAPRMQTG